MTADPSSRSKVWPCFAAMLVILSVVWFFKAYQADQEERDIPATERNGPMSPIMGYAVSALSGVFGLALFVRWLQLVRHPADDADA